VNLLLRIPYAAAGIAAAAASRFAPPGDGKFRTALRARRGVLARFAAWSAQGRDPSRPLVWIHAPSVGEGLQARPVIARLRQRRPDLQVAYTFFSPSAERFARSVGADFADYLPFDTFANARAALEALRPSALVFSKLDVWPALAESAAARGVPLGLISATLAAESTRRSGIAPLLLGDAYRALDAVGAISTDDAARLHQLGVPENHTAITGDARYDEAWARAAASSARQALLAPLASDRPTLVAGSTWPADETPLLEAWRAVRARIPAARLVIAPHEPAASHVTPIERWAAGAGLRCATLSDSAAASADVVIVDRVGVLGDLYALAGVAYVGGGFHSAGLHSVIEPAAFGVPVIFGPRHAASRDAGLLISSRAGFSAESADGIATHVLALFDSAVAREAAGGRAREVVRGGLGAVEKSADIVVSLLDG
jgi:3-deoxy-D-manno-octulosonic-acid transferase